MEKIYRKVLDNGMTLIFEKRKLPVVSVAFAARFGGINEEASEKGISHFIEHMLYKGTPKRNARKIAQDIEKNGGILNGFTDENTTAFWCKMPSKHLELALDVLGDLIKNPVFDEKELEKEKKVIFEEIKMRKDNPSIYAFDKINSYLYESPLGISLIGDKKTVGNIGKEKIMKKFKEIYQPNNLILCVVGNADFDKIVDFAEKNFGKGKGEVSRPKVVYKNDSGVEKREGIDQANLIFAYHVPKIKDKKSYAAEVLSVLTTGGMSSRLFHEIREKRNLAYAIKGASEISDDYAHNFIYVGTSKENVDSVKNLILEEFKKILNDLNEDELNQVKEQIIGNYHISIEDSQSQMVNLLYYEIFDHIEEYKKFEKNILNVRVEDIKEITKKALENHSFFALVPK